MKRAWTRLLASTSALLVVAWAPKAGAQQTQRPFKRRNEFSLAGLRPGVDGFGKAVSRYRRAEPSADGDAEHTWRDGCRREQLVVLLDSSRIVWEVRVAKLGENQAGKVECAAPGRSPWRTGRNLALEDPVKTVIQLYGEPDSRSPSSKAGQRLELLYYAFDWAGPDVPQVMEVLCTVGTEGSPGKVVEITLAASSL